MVTMKDIQYSVKCIGIDGGHAPEANCCLLEVLAIEGGEVRISGQRNSDCYSKSIKQTTNQRKTL